MEFWHNTIIDKSFHTLQALRKEYDFVLIGGWAVFLYTKALKSKDIDIIVAPEILGRLKTQFDVSKNERLKKYEIKFEGFDIDIYLPHWSVLGLPVEFIVKNTTSLGGFLVPTKEILLILKLFVYQQRKGSLKGRKDALDIIALLYYGGMDMDKFSNILKKYSLEGLKDELSELFDSMVEVKELNIGRKQFADFKKKLKSKIHRA